MKTALHTVSYAGVWPGQERLSLEEVVQRAGRLGYDGLMIMAKRPHLSVLEAEEEALERLRGLMEESGVELASLAGYTNFTAGTTHPDIPINEMQLLYVTRLAEMAAALGGSILRIFTSYEDVPLAPSAIREQTLAAIKEAARRVADFGCVLAVQNHHDSVGHYLAYHDFLTDVDEPNCRAAFDAWAPSLQGDDLGEAARHLAPLMVYTTCADYVYRPRFRYEPTLVNYVPETPAVQAVRMGEGMVDYPSFFEALTGVGYEGWVAYEMCSPLRGGGGLDNLDACAAHFLEYMEPWLK